MLFKFHFGRPLMWLVQRHDASEMPIAAMTGWSLISPLCSCGDGSGTKLTFAFSDGHRSLVASDSLVFRTPTIDGATVLDQVQPVLRWLRFVTGQSALGLDLLLAQELNEHVLGDPVDVFSQITKGWHVMRHVELTAINADEVATLLCTSPTLDVPLYAEVLLDAIHAYAFGDHKKVRLYCAIGVEAMATTRLREEFVRATEVSPIQFRLEPDSDTPGGRRHQDSVYTALEKQGRRDFRMLMHELPMYVLRRSILREEPQLYQRLLDLRAQRNSFAHTGDTLGLHGDSHSLASTAIATAIDTFAWFGAAGKYVTAHGHEFVNPSSLNRLSFGGTTKPESA